MKRLNFLIILAGIILSGCTVTHVQQMEFTGPAHKLPARINTSSDTLTHLNARVNFAFNDTKNKAIEYEEREESNIRWNLPSLQTSVEAELNIQNELAVFAALDIAGTNSEDFIGGHFGLGKIFPGDEWNKRIDFQYMYSETRYTGLVGKEPALDWFDDVFEGVDAGYYLVSGKGISRNALISFSTNTIDPANVVNFYLSGGFGWQDLYTLNSTDDYNRVDGSSNIYLINGALFKDIYGMGRIIGGVRYTYYSEFKNGSSLFDFYLQYDLMLF